VGSLGTVYDTFAAPRHTIAVEAVNAPGCAGNGFTVTATLELAVLKPSLTTT